MGISLQETRLSEKLTVLETIELFSGFYRQPRCARRSAGANAARREGRRLGRQAFRRTTPAAAVATALVGNPKILFLDEPTTGLDPQSRRQLWDIIRSFQQAGGTVLLTTHYMDEAERLCDRLAIVDHGQVIAEGTPADLIERLGGHHMVEFQVSGSSNGDLVDVWKALPGVESVRHDNGLVCLNVHEPHLTIPALLDEVTKQGEAFSAPDHTPSQPGRRLRSPDRPPPERRLMTSPPT